VESAAESVSGGCIARPLTIGFALLSRETSTSTFFSGYTGKFENFEKLEERHEGNKWKYMKILGLMVERRGCGWDLLISPAMSHVRVDPLMTSMDYASGSQ